MSELIGEALAEAVIVAALKDFFASRDEAVAVATSVKSGDCVRVYRTGGLLKDVVIGQPQIATDAYAETSARAEQIASLTGAFLRSLEGSVQSGVTIYGVRPFAGIASLPDPATARARYTQTHSIGMRASAL